MFPFPVLSFLLGIYGDQFIILQYIPHMADLVGACKRNKMTHALEGGLIGYISLFKYIITFLSTSTLKELLQVIKTKIEEKKNAF